MSLPSSISLPSIVVILLVSPFSFNTHIVGILGCNDCNFFFLFVFVWFFKLDFGGQICDDVQMFMHILKPKSFIFVVFGVMKVYDVKCVLLLIV